MPNVPAGMYRRFVQAREAEPGLTWDAWINRPVDAQAVTNFGGGATAVQRSARAAKPTEVDGIVFATRLESQVYQHLRSEAAMLPWVLYRQVTFPLLTLAPKPLADEVPRSRLKAHTWTVDFVIVRQDGSWWVHEAKAPRACESRDFQLRLSAFVRAYPAVGVSVWRRERGGLVKEDLWTPPSI